MRIIAANSSTIRRSHVLRNRAARARNVPRRERSAQRFLISILQRYGRDAPDVLRAWADGLEELVEEAIKDDRLPQLDLDPIRL